MRGALNGHSPISRRPFSPGISDSLQITIFEDGQQTDERRADSAPVKELEIETTVRFDYWFEDWIESKETVGQLAVRHLATIQSIFAEAVNRRLVQQ